MITVKKYSNRRLYDTSQSSYITLEDLAAKIRGGADVRVVDAKTDEDLTQQVLAQIILDSRGAARLLPVPLLMRLIRMGDDHLAEFFGQFVSWSLEIYLRFKQGYETMSPYNPFGGIGFGEANPLAQLFGSPASFARRAPWANGESTRTPTEPPPARANDDPAGGPSEDEVAAMRQELDELKDLVRDLTDD